MFYEAVGLEKGSINQLLGPRTILRGLGAMLTGNFAGLPKGDPMVMPGAFLAVRRQLIWEHRATHSGDHPDFAAMRRAWAEHPSAE